MTCLPRMDMARFAWLDFSCEYDNCRVKEELQVKIIRNAKVLKELCHPFFWVTELLITSLT